MQIAHTSVKVKMDNETKRELQSCADAGGFSFELSVLMFKAERCDEAETLLQRCLDGFGAYIHGRKLAKPQRDRLRQDLQDFLEGRRVRTPQSERDVSAAHRSNWS